MCKRCGRWCNRGDFWYLSEHPLVQKFQFSGKRMDTGKCLMLNGNTCLIEKYLGRDAKPDICKEHDCEDSK